MAMVPMKVNCRMLVGRHDMMIEVPHQSKGEK